MKKPPKGGWFLGGKLATRTRAGYPIHEPQSGGCVTASRTAAGKLAGSGEASGFSAGERRASISWNKEASMLTPEPSALAR